MHDDATHGTDAKSTCEAGLDRDERSTEARRERSHERFLLLGVIILAIVTVAVIGWRLIPRSNETAAGYIDPLTQICAVSEDALVALGGKPVANDSFWDGTHLIGAQGILSGSYRSTNTGTCYWARLSGTTGAAQEIIDSAQASGGQQTVKIESSDVAFTSMGCGKWNAVLE